MTCARLWAVFFCLCKHCRDMQLLLHRVNANWSTLFFFAGGKGCSGWGLPSYSVLCSMPRAVQRDCKCSGWGSSCPTETEDGSTARFKCVVRDVSQPSCGPAASCSGEKAPFRTLSMSITLTSPWVSSGIGGCKCAWRAAFFFPLKMGVVHENPITGQAQTFQYIRTYVTDCRSLKVGLLRVFQLFIFELPWINHLKGNWKASCYEAIWNQCKVYLAMTVDFYFLTECM